MVNRTLQDALRGYLAEALPFLRSKVSIPAERLDWGGLIQQCFRELTNLPSFALLLGTVTGDPALAQSLLCYPPLFPEACAPFPKGREGDLLLLNYVAPFLKRYVLRPEIGDYFWNFDEDHFASLYRDLQQYVCQPGIKLRFTVPLLADRKMPTDTLELNHGFKIRPIRRGEEERWERFLTESESHQVQHVLEWQEDCPKTEVARFVTQDALRNASKVTGCLRVLGAEIWAEVMGYGEWPPIFSSDYPTGVVYLHDLMMPRLKWLFIIPEPFAFSDELLKEYRQVWNVIAKLGSSSRLLLAIYRLNDCYSRFRDSDSFIDAWVGLDALCGQEGQELGYSISNRLSFLLAKAFNMKPEDAEAIRDQVKKSYKARGKIIHPRPKRGGRSKRELSEQELRDLADQATNWLRDGIRAAVKLGVTDDVPREVDAAILTCALRRTNQSLSDVPNMAQKQPKG